MRDSQKKLSFPLPTNGGGGNDDGSKGGGGMDEVVDENEKPGSGD